MKIDRSGDENVNRILDGPALGQVHQLGHFKHRRDPVDSKRFPYGVAGLDEAWPYLGAGKGHGQTLGDE